MPSPKTFYTRVHTFKNKSRSPLFRRRAAFFVFPFSQACRMTLNELGQTLPNGFHDSKLLSVFMDYVQCRAELHFAIFVDLLPPASEKHPGRELVYRSAKVTLTGVEYFVVQPPQYAYGVNDAPDFSSDDEGIASHQPVLPELEQEGAFRHWFFASNWNACI